MMKLGYLSPTAQLQRVDQMVDLHALRSMGAKVREELLLEYAPNRSACPAVLCFNKVLLLHRLVAKSRFAVGVIWGKG